VTVSSTYPLVTTFVSLSDILLCIS